MTTRETILARIRSALTVPAPPPRPGVESAVGFVPRAAAAEARRWLPPVPDGEDAWLARFAENAAALKAGFHLLDDEAAAFAKLAELRQEHDWEHVAHQPSPLAEAAARHLGGGDGGKVAARLFPATPGYDPAVLETCDAGITECECLVAQTGSVVINARDHGGRALSVLPPHHVVLARKDQLVPDLPAAYERLYQKYGEPNRWPSMIGFVTGPSRTGDIERILVLGAHGPKRLTILLW